MRHFIKLRPLPASVAMSGEPIKREREAFAQDAHDRAITGFEKSQGPECSHAVFRAPCFGSGVLIDTMDQGK
jgi:hypothetical protein